MYDEQRSKRTIQFIQNLRHTKSPWAGVKFKLAEWQSEKIIKPLYGTINKDGTRQYRTCLVMLPRKNGKSELAAGIALYHLFSDGEIGGEIYSAAVDRDQASLVFNVAAEMVKQNKALNSRCKILHSRKTLVNLKTNSTYRAIPADAVSAHGYNASCVIYDELHGAPNRELFDVLKTSFGARLQPLLFIISTSGFDKHSILYEQCDYGNKILNGVIEDDTFLPVIYSMPEDADWADEANWFKCNPALGDFRRIEEMRSVFKQAKENPLMENTFRRLYLNQWTESETRWLSKHVWEQCGGEVDENELTGRKCYAGLDLSSTQDITAFVLVFPPLNKGEPYKVLPRFFVPEENMRKRSKKDRVPYDLWTRQGFIQTTPGNVVDYEFIKQHIFNDAEKFKIQEVAFDRWGATQIAIQMEEEGLVVVSFGQGYKSMSPAVKELEAKILKQELAHNGNPVLSWMCSNIVVKIDPAENIKFDKAKSTERIDGMVALVMALDRAHVNEDGDSIYETEGILMV